MMQLNYIAMANLVFGFTLKILHTERWDLVPNVLSGLPAIMPGEVLVANGDKRERVVKGLK